MTGSFVFSFGHIQTFRDHYNGFALIAQSFAAVKRRSAMFDLIIRNGHVVDPVNHFDGLADVAIE